MDLYLEYLNLHLPPLNLVAVHVLSMAPRTRPGTCTKFSGIEASNPFLYEKRSFFFRFGLATMCQLFRQWYGLIFRYVRTASHAFWIWRKRGSKFRGWHPGPGQVPVLNLAELRRRTLFYMKKDRFFLDSAWPLCASYSVSGTA
eukprot:SAG11_NODE_218_length_12212_cov_7.026005_18_plen_144_part_00